MEKEEIMEFLDTISVSDFQSLHILVGWKFLDNKVVEKSIKNSMIKVSCVENGKTIGIARVVGDGLTHGLLTDVIVHPDFQGKGVGKAMITYLLGKLQEYVNKNCDEFMLELTPTKDNAAFYVKCGFKHKPEEIEGCYLWLKNQNIYASGSKKYVMHLQEQPFENIKHERKTIEMRLNDEKRRVIKENDIIIFIKKGSSTDYIKTRVKALHKYKNFAELYTHFDKTSLGYAKNEQASPDDMTKYYPKEEIEKYGVVGIEIEFLKK